MFRSHRDVELGCAVAILGIVTAIIFPLAKRLPPQYGIPLASIPLALLIAIVIYFWRGSRNQ